MLRSDPIKENLNAFLEILKEGYKEELVSLVLYGSFARGDYRKNSDIDLILVLEKCPPFNSERMLDFYKILEKKEEWAKLRESGYTGDINTITFSREESMENRYLFIDVSQEGIILFDKEKFFEKRMEAMRNRLKELGSRKTYLPDGTYYWELKPDIKFGEIFEL